MARGVRKIKAIDESKMTLGQYLKLLRVDANLTQPELSDAIGVNRVTISAYESDRILPPPDKLKLFADYFDIGIDMLMSKIPAYAGHNSDGSNSSSMKASREDNIKIEQLVYYYKNISDSKKQVLYDLAKALYTE